MKAQLANPPENLGAGLQEVEVNFVGTGSNRVTTKWFHGRTEKQIDADVLVWMDWRNNIIKQQTSISGVIVEWNILDGLRTGVIVEQEIKDAEASESVRFDSSSNDMSVQMAVRLLNEVPCMDEPTKKLLVRNFCEPSSIETLPPQEVLYRYGRGPHGVTMSIWQKFKVSLRRWLS